MLFFNRIDDTILTHLMVMEYIVIIVVYILSFILIKFLISFNKRTETSYETYNHDACEKKTK